METKLLIKSIVITASFFMTYSTYLVIRLYQFISKSQVSATVDLIGAVGISMNTLLNSLILIYFDGTVQSSVIEMLGLQDWWKARKNAAGGGPKDNHNLQIMQSNPKDEKHDGNQGLPPTINIRVGEGSSPFSIATQKMNHGN